MTILAIDTATPMVSCALSGPGGLIGEFTAMEGRRHGEILAPAIDALCREHGVSLRDMEAVAVDIGPGLFTGLRVGVATAKALASALSLPLIGVNSLEALAQPHGDDGRQVAAVVDIRRGEVAWALFEPVMPEGPAGWPLAERRPPQVVAPPGLAEALFDISADGHRRLKGRAADVLVVGDGARRYSSSVSGIRGVDLAGSEFAHPSARSVAAVASQRLATRSQTAAAPHGADVTPLYLRAADVRIGWVVREQPVPVENA